MIEAVSAILIHESEVFAIRRQPYLRAFPGYHAFPGGKIDSDDEVNCTEVELVQEYPASHITALYRELSEELEFDLVEELDRGGVRNISLFGTAITPAFEAIRFRAYYYKIVLEQKPLFKFDTSEIAEGGWQTAANLYDLYLGGQALMVVPMRNTLLKLAQDIRATNCEPFNFEVPQGELPCIEFMDGLKMFPIPSNTLPPATTTNALLLGDKGQPQVLVDPSPESEEVYTRLTNSLSGRHLDAIFISHHHPDHHERAFDLAREKNVPVLLGRITLERLKLSYGDDYVVATDLKIIDEGHKITRWKGEAVRAFELPGHDDGMLGLVPDNLAWFFVADLVQNPGTVVIPDSGGDLVDYLTTLQRLIKLDPKVILPSHGIASGGTESLKQAYQHRMERENQIRPLYLAGASTEVILNGVYPELREDLKWLAVQTIRQHIRKLKQEAGQN